MNDTIYLTPYKVNPTTPRLPGELTLDGQARVLGVGDKAFVLSAPLLPERTLGGEDVRLMTREGVVHGPLEGGGGGQPQDKGWIVPGCAPYGVETLPFITPRTVSIELSEPGQLLAMRMRSQGGTANVNVKMRTEAGALVVDQDFALNGPATLEPFFENLHLLPGRYAITATPTASVLLEQLQVVAPWSPLPLYHVVAVRFL